MTTTDLLFTFFAMLAMVPAILCVGFTKNIVRAAFLLMLSFWGVAGLYGMLAADFLMAVQLIVYVGGILVLILFGVMLSRRMTNADLPVHVGPFGSALILVVALGWLLWEVISGTPWAANGAPADGATLDAIGDLFLGKFLLPFEVISLLLLAALVGAVILTRKEIGDPQDEGGARS